MLTDDKWYYMLTGPLSWKETFQLKNNPHFIVKTIYCKIKYSNNAHIQFLKDLVIFYFYYCMNIMNEKRLFLSILHSSWVTAINIFYSFQIWKPRDGFQNKSIIKLTKYELHYIIPIILLFQRKNWMMYNEN